MFLVTAIISYLLGSISFAVIFTYKYTNKDVRNEGSGNAGLTNVIRSGGKMPAILTLVFDLLKAIVSIMIGYGLTLLINYLLGTNLDPIYAKYIAGLFCFIGHIYPIYFQFRGGKGVLSLLGIMLCCNWRAALVCLSLFIIVLIISKMVSLSSIMAALSLPFVTRFLFLIPTNKDTMFILPQSTYETIAVAIFALVVIIKHIPNIKRIFSGTENKFSLHSKKNKTED
jgi:glycerol-3-phosphate acyltransferase PlsY